MSKQDTFLAEYPERAVKELEAIAGGMKPYSEQKQPVEYRAQAPDKGVSLDGGPLRTCFERNINYISEWYDRKGGYRQGAPEQAPDQVDEATVDTVLAEEKNFWERELPASSEGRVLGAAANTYRWTGREDMHEIMTRIVGLVGQRQRDDGYCLPYNLEGFDGSKDAWKDERRNYDRVMFTRGMIDAGRAGNSEAYQILRRFYDWFHASPFCSRQLIGPFTNGSSHNCNNAHDGSLLMYFSPVGQELDLEVTERYLVQDFLIEAARDREPLCLSHYPLHTAHCYVLPAFKAWIDLYRATGRKKYLDGARGAWNLVRDHYLHVGRGLAICEGDIGDYPPGSYYINSTKEHHTGETCGSVFWAEINHRLLQLFPQEVVYADEIEMAVFNIVLAAQAENGKIRYHNQLQHQLAKAYSTNTCCEVTGSPFIADLPKLLYSVAPDGLFVNLLAASTIRWHHGTVPVEACTQTDFPHASDVSMTISTESPVSFKLRIRLPHWLDDSVQVSVNGTASKCGKPGTFVEIDRQWEDGDTVTYALPMPFRLVRYTGVDGHSEHPSFALLRGPILLALVGSRDIEMNATDLIPCLYPLEEPLHFGISGRDDTFFQPYWQLTAENTDGAYGELTWKNDSEHFVCWFCAR